MPGRKALTPNPQTNKPNAAKPQAIHKNLNIARRDSLNLFVEQGNQGSRTRHREDHYTPEKIRMECVWKNLSRRY
jgi:hypothetical protein